MQIKQGSKKASWNFLYVRSNKDTFQEGMSKIGETTKVPFVLPSANFADITPFEIEATKEVLKVQYGFKEENGVVFLDDEQVVTEILSLPGFRYGKDASDIKAADFRGHYLVFSVDNERIISDTEIHKKYSNFLVPPTNPTVAGETEWLYLSPHQSFVAIKNFVNGKEISGDFYRNYPDMIFFEDLTEPQQEAVEFLVDAYGNYDRGRDFLIDAIMRFGKTVSVLFSFKKFNKIEKKKPIKYVLLMSHFVGTSKNWLEDIFKVFSVDEVVVYSQNRFAIKEYREKFGKNSKPIFQNLGKAIEEAEQSGKLLIAWNSLQQGKFDLEKEEEAKLNKVDWDVLAIDEAHMGTRSSRTLEMMKQFEKLQNIPKIIEISGTPFNIQTEYPEENVFKYTYFHELEDKQWIRKNVRPEDMTPSQRRMMELPEISFQYLSQVDKNGEKKDWSRAFSELIYDDGGKLEEEASRLYEIYEKEGIEEEEIQVKVEEGLDEYVNNNDIPFKFRYRGEVENFTLLMFTSENGKATFPFYDFKEQTKEDPRAFKYTILFMNSARHARAYVNVLKELRVTIPATPWTAEREKLIFEDFAIVSGVYEDWKEDWGNVTIEEAVEKAIATGKPVVIVSWVRLGTGTTIPEISGVFMLNNNKNPISNQQLAFRGKNPWTLEDGRKKEGCSVFYIDEEAFLNNIHVFYRQNHNHADSFSDTLKKLKVGKVVFDSDLESGEYFFESYTAEEVEYVLNKDLMKGYMEGDYRNIDVSKMTMTVAKKDLKGIGRTSTASIGVRPKTTGGKTLTARRPGKEKDDKEVEENHKEEKEKKEKELQDLYEFTVNLLSYAPFVLSFSGIDLDSLAINKYTLSEDYEERLKEVEEDLLITWFGEKGAELWRENMFKIPTIKSIVLSWLNKLSPFIEGWNID